MAIKVPGKGIRPVMLNSYNCLSLNSSSPDKAHFNQIIKSKVRINRMSH